MTSEDVKLISEWLSKPRKIAIIPHKNPDGDAIGSTLGLNHYLLNNGHDSVVIVPNEYPNFLKWMPGNEAIINFEKENRLAVERISEAEIIFTLDFNDLSRTGQMQQVLKNASAKFIMIDHHQEPMNYAQIVYSDVTMSSTCEMVYNFIEKLEGPDKITSAMANCLYAGIVTDTGSFKYPATTSQTHRVVAELIERGANSTKIHQNIFDTYTPGRMHLLGCALKNMIILEQYNTTFITLSREELEEHNYQKGDTEGVVNYGLALQGIKFAVIFIENKEEDLIKISFRSVGDFSVNEFARAHFDGGGHTNAAGGKSERSLEDTTSYFISLLENYKEQLA